MIALKEYQNRVLFSLRAFLKASGNGIPPAEAFREVVTANGGPDVPYQAVHAASLPLEMPYSCVRVPTGGGKTLIACHAVGIAKDELLHAERSVVLWLVPSNTILDQTADALRDPSHPYRRALEVACGGPVEVLTIEEALRLSRATVDSQTVVIVSTIQAFRVEDTTGRKVYDQNGSFAEHLQNLPADRLADLLPGADGKPKPSLVNVLRLRRPIVIVDEAHNARTLRSFAALADVRPSCVIELTATPSNGGTEIISGKKEAMPPSNVLHRVSAAELKAANMVKLPLRVITRHPSQKDALLADAITLRSDLEKLAAVESQATGEYLRPIMLIQAERVDACEPLRERMVTEFGIAREEIIISTGTKDELKDSRDIGTPKSKVRFILTVEKLREGWDCPFAYVLCSLKETRSATAIEQIVGRILRLPRAAAKQHPDLNCAYAFSVSESIHDVLSELKDALEHNGFTAAEAERIIIPVPQGVLPLGVQPKTVALDPSTEVDMTAVRKEVDALAGKARLDASTGALTIFVPLDEAETERLAGCAKTTEARQRIEATVESVREAERAFGGTGATRVPSPYEQQLDFIVPLLCVDENGQHFEFESTFLLEHPWRLGSKDATIRDAYNPLERPKGKQGVVDIEGKGTVTTTVVQESASDATASDYVSALHQQVMQLGGVSDWTLEALIAWLDRQIEHSDIPASESAEFLRKALNGLIARYGITDLGLLALDRFRLRDEIQALIEAHRESERAAAFRDWLLPQSALTVSDSRTINFKAMSYEPGWLYDGSFTFQKHYFGPKPGELREKRGDGALTEEFKCAQFLDGLPEVRFWIRNLSRKSSSFRLQTATDWFYPDFLCQLTDGRILVVEFKGEHLWQEAEEKRAVGAVWESRSSGRCLFIMPKGFDLAAISSTISTKP